MERDRLIAMVGCLGLAFVALPILWLVVRLICAYGPRWTVSAMFVGIVLVIYAIANSEI